MKFISGFLLILFSLVSHAQTPSLSPEQTIRQIYSAYATDAPLETPDFFGDLSDKSVLSARMKAAVHKDQQATPPGDMGALDADPFCACQDYEHLVLEEVTIHPADRTHINATVQIRPFGNDPDSSRYALTLKLVRENERWLVDDVISEYGSTLQQLKDANP